MLKAVIVGNAPEVLSNTNGEFIDSCDCIVRFNDFIIKGYEESIGTKTTHWCVSIFSVYNLIHNQNKACDANLGGMREMWTSSINLDARGEVAKFVFNYSGLSPAFVRTYNRQLEMFYTKVLGVAPSNGFMAVVTAIEILDDYDIYITGFGDGDGHYYNEAHPKGTHDFNRERFMLDSLVNVIERVRYV